MLVSSVQLIRCIEVILAPAIPTKVEEHIPSGIGECRSHPMGCCRLADGTDRASSLINRGGGDLMLAQSLAYDVESARQRGIAKGLFCPAWSIRTDSRYQRFFWIDEFSLGFGQRRGVPAPVQVLGGQAKLDEEVAG